MTMDSFIKTIWAYYRKHGRDLPWRHNITPYRIVVSEIMLQQTQASRVTKKFDSFLKRFPNWESLVHVEYVAPLADILQEWQGLGYNRRALNLHRLAETIQGKLPQSYEELVELPGIGPNTAGSILAFAFNIPHPFIETNIRTVFIHFFFKKTKKDDGRKVHDKKLMPLITAALADKRNQKNPREWYYALMDYGSMLKQTEVNPSRRSTHHTRQSKFKGSNRELRSHILKVILKQKMSEEEIVKAFPDKKVEMVVKNLEDLKKEGFVECVKGVYGIRK